MPGEVRHLFRFGKCNSDISDTSDISFYRNWKIRHQNLVRGHSGDMFYLRKRQNIRNYDSILSTHPSAGCTMAPNWQNGASFTVQLTGTLSK